MAGLKQLDIDPANLDPDGIAENQTLGGAGNVTLNGALCDLGTAARFDIGDAYSAGIGGVKLLFDSAGDISGVTFTITGKDQDGITITPAETVTGVTTTAVSTTNFYSEVTQIAADGAVASNLFIGTVTGELSTRTIPLNHYSESAAGLAVSGLTGTCQYDIQETFEEINGTAVGGWYDVTNGTDLSADGAVSATRGATGVRLKFDSYTDGAELQFHVSYNPYR